ncbi:DnaJ domain containing protein [Nitzschia inconspicua]|uniref:DnaJ domain containing protein n=1 Tax=Nitzschia inconspicua TaxID=303405 RepID=A0A9K3LUV7_9STRA|nr:DnaJ domain containing protein [Nitzschia inconspicua]
MTFPRTVLYRNWQLVAFPCRRKSGSSLPTTRQYGNLQLSNRYQISMIASFQHHLARRFYFTNGQVTKRDDPYAILGLEWGDGATTAEIRKAFRERAKALHPDVVDTSQMSLERAQQDFQKLVWAYEALLKHVQADVDHDSIEEWRVALWRQSDRIAMDRTDVAGTLRKRPAPPAQTESRLKAYGRELGHPSGKGVGKRGEFLSDGTNAKGKLRSSSVGRGQSKWIQSSKQREYKEWNPSS